MVGKRSGVIGGNDELERWFEVWGCEVEVGVVVGLGVGLGSMDVGLGVD